MNFQLPQGLQAQHILGCGSFGQVYSCFDTHSNKQYALKIISKESLSHSRIRLFYKQAEILSAVHHKNIVTFHSFHENDSYLFIKMQLIKGSTLKKLMQQRNNNQMPFKQSEIAIFFKHLLQAIRYLHSLNIIHRDLKPDNILFQDNDDLSTIKIVDFGLSAKLEMHNPANIKAQCGTLLYMAPQIFNKPSYTKSVDLWSCAVIMYMLFNQGNHPFYRPGMKTHQFKLKLKNQQFPPLNNPLAQDFIDKISKKEYEQRYNVSQAIKHPWITRNEADEIPLSIHEEYKGFDSANEIVTITKLFIGVGLVFPHQRKEISEQYSKKVKDFSERNEVVRECSPSRRKRRDKNNQLFIKMKKMLQPHQTISNDEPQPQQQNTVLEHHQQFYHCLFQKHITAKSKHIKIDQISQSRIFNTEMEKNQEDNLPKTDKSISIIDKKFRVNIEHHIQAYVNQIITQNKGDLQRKIFHKKQMEKPIQPKQRPNLRIVKRLSYQSEKQLVIEDMNSFQSPKKQMVRQGSTIRRPSSHIIYNAGNKRLWK